MSVQSINTMSPVAEKDASEVKGQFCDYRGQRFYKIDNYDQMPRFFMSVVSAYDHWLFISSNGGLTAGRQNAQKSLFPYYTEDKISDMAHCTGPITLIRENGQLWQPFETASLTAKPGQRTLYKSALGDQLYFSETKQGLCFEYGWSFSETYGIVRTVTLTNNSEQARSVDVLDGLQNLLPANISSDSQNDNSVLLDAYKSADCYDGNIAAYYLSSQLTDLAEPAESLLANAVWHSVVSNNVETTVSIDTNAPQKFAQGQVVDTRDRQRGQRGAYFIETQLTLAPGEKAEWHLVCEVSLDVSKIQSLRSSVKRGQLAQQIRQDILQGSQTLHTHLAKTDALQASEDELTAVHHQANALFNMMRGGFFEDGYLLDKHDIQKFVVTRQRDLGKNSWWQTLPESLSVLELESKIASCESVDLRRLVREYLPISFSRRHGDPSRPWNKFSINLKNNAGESIKDYQGNWRDIFQNWEPLAYSYPKFLPAMISAFLNATTADGYNPYRVTRDGIEWEEPEPDNAWSNIGYWSDHQIIYLSKLLELQAEMNPEWLASAFAEPRYSFANVPYRIKPFAELQNDPYDSINFDYDLNSRIEARVKEIGTDGKLLADAQGRVIHTNLIEKLLTLWLAKLSNFVPDGGLWMNTQRPEWNDANNALVGWGLSVVTVGYLHRHLSFMRQALSSLSGQVSLSAEVHQWFNQVQSAFKGLQCADASQRFQFIETLATDADHYRAQLYQRGLTAATKSVSVEEIIAFIDAVLPAIASTLKANRRGDGLYHGYNLLHIENKEATVQYLPLMLEGQVAILSSKFLSGSEALKVLQALRHSDLYREDQHTYLLYPNKVLPKFIEKNQIESSWLEDVLQFKAKLLAERILFQSADGHFHFDVKLRNAKDLKARLTDVSLSDTETQAVLALFERTFNHKSFTGRSGSFFAYEGLGSTYWHMVSKLLLAAQENWFLAREENPADAAALEACYYDIRAGIGFNKTPSQYGAFPTDPYSHTPETGIARQPGMTGQVKEELITRFGELGLVWHQGGLRVQPGLLRATEFLTEARQFSYLQVDGIWHSLALPAKSVAFTLAQVPFVYRAVESSQPLKVRLQLDSGEVIDCAEGVIDCLWVEKLAQRNGEIRQVEVDFPIDKAVTGA